MGQHCLELGTECRTRSWCEMCYCAVSCSALDMEGPVSGEGSRKDSLGCISGIALACHVWLWDGLQQLFLSRNGPKQPGL